MSTIQKLANIFVEKYKLAHDETEEEILEFRPFESKKFDLKPEHFYMDMPGHQPEYIFEDEDLEPELSGKIIDQNPADDLLPVKFHM